MKGVMWSGINLPLITNKYQVKLGAYVNHFIQSGRAYAIGSRARLGYEQHSRLEIGAMLSSCIC